MSLGLPELLIVLAVVLLIMGPKRIGRVGRQLGGSVRELTTSVRNRVDDDEQPRGDATPDDEPVSRNPKRD